MVLPVASPWFTALPLDARTWVVTEPHVHPVFAANIHLVLGREADLLIDSGMGIAPLGPFIDRLRPVPARPLLCLVTHAHVDHIGGAHEFDLRLVHPLEAADLAKPEPCSLLASALSPRLKAFAEAEGCPFTGRYLIDALPEAGYAPETYRLRGAAATRLVTEGDTIDLGDWRAEVLHLPGHSPGQVGLWHPPSGTLFGADAIYDGGLIWEGPGTDLAAYRDTLRRIAALPVRVVHGGHEPAFGPDRMGAIVARHLALWG